MYERKLINDACGTSISESCELQTAIQGFANVPTALAGKRLANKRRRDNTLIREENSIDRERQEEEKRRQLHEQ